jgi:hypothetical protein
MALKTKIILFHKIFTKCGILKLVSGAGFRSANELLRKHWIRIRTYIMENGSVSLTTRSKKLHTGSRAVVPGPVRYRFITLPHIIVVVTIKSANKYCLCP